MDSRLFFESLKYAVYLKHDNIKVQLIWMWHTLARFKI